MVVKQGLIHQRNEKILDLDLDLDLCSNEIL